MYVILNVNIHEEKNQCIFILFIYYFSTIISFIYVIIHINEIHAGVKLLWYPVDLNYSIFELNFRRIVQEIISLLFKKRNQYFALNKNYLNPFKKSVRSYNRNT